MNARESSVSAARAVSRGIAALSAVARIADLHQQYLPAAVEFDCCSHCNTISGGYIAWPCPTMQALEGR